MAEGGAGARKQRVRDGRVTGREGKEGAAGDSGPERRERSESVRRHTGPYGEKTDGQRAREGSGHSRPNKGQVACDLQGAGGSVLETPTLRSMGSLGCGLLLRTRGQRPPLGSWELGDGLD